MTSAELESLVLQIQQTVAGLRSGVSGLQANAATLLEMQREQSAHERKMWEDQWAHNRDMQDRHFLYTWKQRFQFQALKEMLFESADKLGLTTEQMEADFERRWKARLDENLRKLEDTHPNLAGRVDERTEDELPDY